MENNKQKSEDSTSMEENLKVKYGKDLIVRYDNFVNKVSLGALTEVENNLFFALLQLLKDKDEDQYIDISFSQIRQITGITYATDSFIQVIDELQRVLGNIRCEAVYSADSNTWKTLFHVFEIIATNENRQIFRAKLTPEFAFILKNLRSNYTAFPLKEFIFLSGKHAKTIYRLLKQWRTVGCCDLSYGKLVSSCGISSKLQPKYVMRNIIKPAVEQIQLLPEFHHLTVKVITDAKNSRLCLGYHFDWREQKELELSSQNDVAKDSAEISEKPVAESKPAISHEDKVKMAIRLKQKSHERSVARHATEIDQLFDDIQTFEKTKKERRKKS